VLADKAYDADRIRQNAAGAMDSCRTAINAPPVLLRHRLVNDAWQASLTDI
jgi:hypothetical protein